jgi:dihydroflavonol-4-reductase
MRVLVTGASGLLGNNVTRLLLERGNAVRLLTRTTSNPRTREGLDVEVAPGDVRDAESVRRALDGIDAVVHAAAQVQVGWTGLEQARAINVDGTRNVAHAAREHGIRMVHVSSVDALGLGTIDAPAHEETPPIGGVLCPYVVTKREAEQVVLQEVAKGLRASIVNPAYMLGPWDWKPSSGRMLLHVAKGWALFAPLGQNSFCDVRDVAAGIVAALDRGQPGRRYVLAGETLSYFQAWRIFADVTGARRPRFPVGPLVRYGAGWCGDMWTKLTGREGDVNSAATAIAAQKRCYSSARAEAELGYQRRPVRESAEAAWKWFRDFGYAK